MERQVKKMVVGSSLILLLFSGGFFLFATGGEDKVKAPQEKIESLSKCLAEANATMFGMETCPHCQHQKDMFGDYFDRVEYVECTEQREKCRSEGISGVPVWKINGEQLKGTQKLQKLSDAAGCGLNMSG